MLKFVPLVPVLCLATWITACNLFADPGTSTRASASSANFAVRTYRGGPAAAKLVGECEKLRLQLQRHWLGNSTSDSWQPRCEIVLHSSRANYQQAVGPGSGQTFGSSLVRISRGQIIVRRIDLLLDQQGQLSALSHELTHVILADRFGGRQPPRWLDEGIATLSDSRQKRQLHYRDCRDAIRYGTALRLVDLMLLDRFTSSDQIAAFYGQSLSLVQYLTMQNEPARLLDFTDTAMRHGYDRALQQHYGIENIGVLEHRWRNSLQRVDKPKLEVVPVSFEP